MVRQAKKKDESMLVIFFDITGIVYKEFVLIGQAANSAYYCTGLRRLLENVRRLHPDLSDKRTGCCITATHYLTLPFSPGMSCIT
jgi:hypothetical protein